MLHEHATLQCFRTAFNVASLPTTYKTCKDVLGTASHVFKVDSGWLMFTHWRRDLFLAPPALLSHLGCDARLPLRQWRPWQRSKAPACTAYGKSWPRRGGCRRHIVRNPLPKHTTIPSKCFFLKKGPPKSISQPRLIRPSDPLKWIFVNIPHFQTTPLSPLFLAALYSSSATVPWQERKDEAARRASWEEERQKPWTTKHGRARNRFATIVAQNPKTHQICSRNIM